MTMEEEMKMFAMEAGLTEDEAENAIEDYSLIN